MNATPMCGCGKFTACMCKPYGGAGGYLGAGSAGGPVGAGGTPLSGLGTQSCPYCVSGFHSYTACPRISSIEYYPDGQIKRIELRS